MSCTMSRHRNTGNVNVSARDQYRLSVILHTTDQHVLSIVVLSIKLIVVTICLESMRTCNVARCYVRRNGIDNIMTYAM